MTQPEAISWHELPAAQFEGRGWSQTLRPFDRLPARAQQAVPEVVWNLSRSATGMAAWFETDAPAVHARWRLQSAQLGEPNFPVAGFSGLDLYAEDSGRLKWVGAGHLVKDQEPQQCLIEGMAGASRRFLCYLPARNPVEGVEIGVPRGASFRALPPRAEKPLVFYGSSIVHGAYASHAGMIHPAILGRRLGLPTINLGFSGNAKMEIALAELLAELDARVYILDALPNMDLSLVRERAELFIRSLRKAKPATPIVMVEDRPLGNLWIKPSHAPGQEEKWRFHRALFDKLSAEGAGPLFYLEGRNLFGADADGSLDASHPSDLGFFRMADALEPVLRRALA